MSAEILHKGRDGDRLVPVGYEDHPPGRLVGEQGHVLMALGLGGLIDGQAAHLAEIRRADGLIHVALAQRHDPMNREATDSGCPGEGRLPCQEQYERFKQQREAGELAGPGRNDLHHLAVGQLHSRHPYRQLALVLEEIQVPVALRHRVMHRMLTRLTRHGEAAADLEVDANVQLPLARLEVHPSDEPGAADAQCRLEDLLCDHVNPSIPFPRKRTRRVCTVPPDGVFHVGPQALASLARPLGPAAESAGPSAGFGAVDYVENRATSGRIIHSDFNRAHLLYSRSPRMHSQLSRRYLPVLRRSMLSFYLRREHFQFDHRRRQSAHKMHHLRSQLVFWSGLESPYPIRLVSFPFGVRCEVRNYSRPEPRASTVGSLTM